MLGHEENSDGVLAVWTELANAAVQQLAEKAAVRGLIADKELITVVFLDFQLGSPGDGLRMREQNPGLPLLPQNNVTTL